MLAASSYLPSAAGGSYYHTFSMSLMLMCDVCKNRRGIQGERLLRNYFRLGLFPAYGDVWNPYKVLPFGNVMKV